MSHEVEAQREYYVKTAKDYDALHVNQVDEHAKALGAFVGLAAMLGPVESVLDVGAGTGRGLQRLKAGWPGARVIGIEPVEALRREGYRKGLSQTELINGDALNLAFEDNAFDYVVETGVLHHIKTPIDAVKEMTRVARKGIMISDSNNIGQGNTASRYFKYIIKSLCLWRAFVWVQTGGKMYKVSDGDGVFYSFSAFDCVESFKCRFPMIHYLNTERCNGFNLYR